MRGPIILPLITALLFSLPSVVGKQAPVSATQQHGQTPANNSQQSKASQRDEIELKITPIIYSNQVYDFVATERYKAGDPISFEMTMTNRTDENISVHIMNQYAHFRPRLLKDGVPVQYRKEIRKTVQDTENDFRQMGSSVSYTLLPSVPQRIGYLELKYWYEPLEPGHYELTLKHRFGGVKQPVESNTATFEVGP